MRTSRWEAAELQHARLLFMELETKLHQALLEIDANLLCITPGLEAHHEVVSVPHDTHLPSRDSPSERALVRLLRELRLANESGGARRRSEPWSGSFVA